MRRFSPVAILLFVSALVSQATEPIDIGAGRGRNWSAIKLVNEANAAIDRGDLNKAYNDANAAVRIDPSLWPAFYTRARVFVVQRKFREAIRDCDEVLKQDSTFVPAALLRAEANSGLGNNAAALKEINHVISIQPRERFYAMAYRERALLYVTCQDPALRNGKQALQDALTACRMRLWKDSIALAALACAYAENADFDSAIRYAAQAISMESDGSYAARKFRKHLTLFQQHRPVRE